jgi:membrane protease subunit HflK
MFILKNNPWGQRPQNGKGGDGGDNIDDMLRDAQNRFKNKMGGGGGGFSAGGLPQIQPEKAFLLILAALAFLWLGTGFYRVEPEENAVILTFGKWTDTRNDAGLGYHLPYPIQDEVKVNVAFDRRIEIGFRDQTTRTEASSIATESMMLTGDENIVDINFVVLWRVSDAGKYLFKIRDPETTIKKVAESAMRETVGRTVIQKALTEARGSIETDTKVLMQKILDEYESGVTINSVQLLRVDPPSDVVDAFNDVQRARTDLERLKNEAETYRNDIVPKARGEAQKMIQGAEAYKKAITSTAEGESARFNSIYSAYAQSKEVTQKRIYLETMQDIMKNSRKIIVGDNGSPVLPYMQLEQPKSPQKQP